MLLRHGRIRKSLQTGKPAEIKEVTNFVETVNNHIWGVNYNMRMTANDQG